MFNFGGLFTFIVMNFPGFKYTIAFAFMLFALSNFAQSKADSLLKVIETSTDKEKANLYCKLAWEYFGKDYDKFNQYSTEGYKVALKSKSLYYQAYAMRQIGIYHDVNGDAKKSIYYIDSALKINRKINDEGGIIACLSSLGIVHYNAGNYSKALPLYIESLEYYEKTNDLKYQAYFAGNIGGIYRSLGDKPNTKIYYEKAVELAEKSQSKKSMAIAYNNLGSEYYAEGDYDKAEVMLKKGLQLKEELKESQGISYSLHSLAELYNRKKDYPKAKEIAERILAINETTKDKKLQIYALEDLGDVNLNLKDTIAAEKYYLKAYQLSKESENMQTLMNAAYSLSKIHNSRKDYKNSLFYYNEYAVAKDSVFQGEKFKSINEMQSKYESEKKEQQIALLSKEKLLKDAELRRSNAERMHKIQQLELSEKEKEMKDILLQKSQIENDAKAKENEVLKLDQKMKESELARAEAEKKQADELSKRRTQQLYGMIGVSLLVLCMLFLIFRGYRQKQKANKELTEKNDLINQQKKEVEHQKELVDEKNKEITDSINYAKRLQEAILPPLAAIQQTFPDSFVLYKPKDIVAGDFYWMHEAIDEAGNKKTFIAAADCTGHGVPGAMVSVVCSNALNRTVKEFGITETGKILDKVRELVIETFEKSVSEVKDGMDISLMCIENHDSENNTTKITWSGANNPLWYIEKDVSSSAVENRQIIEIKADKQPIGKYDALNPFTTHQLELPKNTSFYMFTDGYADQFGGEKGKKFKYKQLVDKISSIQHLKMQEQHEMLNKTFENWKDKLEQIDDVCVIGIRL